MAKIVFTWELGQGYGHLVRYVELIKRLLKDQHDVWFLAKNSERAKSVFGELPVHVEGIPAGYTPVSERLSELHSNPDILHNFGFFASAPLEQQLRGWVEKLAAINPDLLIIDHSPMIQLANQVCRIKSIASGSGFTVPQASSPMRPMRFWSMPDLSNVCARESRVLAIINQVLHRYGTSPVAAVADVLSTDKQWLWTFRELDHYGFREAGNYLGNFPQADFGDAPTWGGGDRIKLFAYLSGNTLPREFPLAVKKIDADLCLFAPNLRFGEIEKFAGVEFQRATTPVDLARAAVECDAALTQGGLNSASTFLLYGKPVVTLVDNLERYMVGRRLELLGAGLSVPVHEAKLLYEKLRVVVNDRSFSRNAERFRERYRRDTVDAQLDRAMLDISDLLLKHA
ncbi:MAG: hypothetical protein O3C28_03855 [Proteobacteria bacterium]|nr:hypothetical protein [Pseudomonadota bacterium]